MKPPLILIFVAVIGTNLLADEAPKDTAAPELSVEERQEVLRLRRSYGAARDDAEARRKVIKRAIELGEPGVGQVLPLISGQVGKALDSYGKVFANAARNYEQPEQATAANVIATSEALQAQREELLALGELVVLLEKAAGRERPDPETLLSEHEEQFLRMMKLGPIYSQLSDAEIEAITATNKRRASEGLPPLEVDLGLCQAARDHASDMVEHNFFSHESPVSGKKSFGDRARLFGTSARSENIHSGARSGESAVEGWMNSDGHRANILDSRAKRIGVGMAGRKWVQMFGS